jgi:hypothetical protein
VINIRARNKIIAGKYQEFRFKIKLGRLYLCCLENELIFDSSTVHSVLEMSYSEATNGTSMLARGYVGNIFLGTLGMIVGFSTARRRGIYRLQIVFAEGGIGIAEVDNLIYEKIMQIVCKYV